MQVSIHAHQVALSPGLSRYLQEQLVEPLQRIWNPESARLEVHLSDLRGGDKAGIDQECRCTLRMPDGPQLVITEVSEEMRRSIHQARRRLLRRVRGWLSRRSLAQRRPRKQFLARMEHATAPRHPRHAPLPDALRVAPEAGGEETPLA